MQFYIDSRLIVIALIWSVLALFGYFYNNAVARKMAEGYREHVWLFVVVGVAVTLTGAAMRDPSGALWVLSCFGASGAWMIYGSINRNVTQKRINEQKAMLAVRAALAELKQDVKV